MNERLQKQRDSGAGRYGFEEVRPPVSRYMTSGAKLGAEALGESGDDPFAEPRRIVVRQRALG
jgi:hypothetical protein